SHQRKLPSIDAICGEFNDASKMQCEVINHLVKEHKARYGLNATKPTNTGLPQRWRHGLPRYSTRLPTPGRWDSCPPHATPSTSGHPTHSRSVSSLATNSDRSCLVACWPCCTLSTTPSWC